MCNKIFLRGFRDNIHNEIRKASMFILSSDYEGISNAMIEALEIGMPVISTDCPIGGARMFIRHNYNGMLVPVGDANVLAKEMDRLAKDIKLVQKIQEHAVQIKSQLNTENIVQQWEDFTLHCEVKNGNENFEDKDKLQ